jgi:hypothetical protein
VTGHTARRCPVITARVTVHTTRRQMPTRQRERCRVVVENMLRITGRVTSQAGRTLILITSDSCVHIFRLRVNVTSRAAEQAIIRCVGMTFDTTDPSCLMRTTVYWKMYGIMLRIQCRHPARIRCMTGRTVCREISNFVIRGLCTFIFRLMTCHTIGRRI